MTMKCLFCYNEISEQSKYEFHSKCSKKIYGNTIPPELDVSLENIYELASESINRSIAVTGVQEKLSLDITHSTPKRFTIVGLWGGYILKPPSSKYNQLPEIEDITMHLAEIFGIKTAVHSLIRLKSGELAYITKRFDRDGSRKISAEDLCQLSGELTEHKYRGSLEKVCKTILKFSDQPGLDKINFFEICLFSYLVGNSDMHLKNFSMFTDINTGVKLSPAYDLLSTKIIIPDDKEESALTINGKKNNLNLNDFTELAGKIALDKKVVDNIFGDFSDKIKECLSFLDKGFLSNDTIDTYKSLMKSRSERFKLM